MNNTEMINDIQDRIIEETERFEDGIELYEYLVERGKRHPALEDRDRTGERLLGGCQSKVWLYTECLEGKVRYHADSDALITKGMISLMIRVLDGHTPDEILGSDLYFIERTGLKEHLSPMRRTGLVSIVNRMKELAADCV
ncbi:MAG: SufE family protein [Candidatus Omnitrophica bacterium]|nr:SufE family protein [Candidatus Omnitrophota bacterium]